MASNDFLIFAGQAGANVVSQSTYASLAALGPGFQTGIAESNQLNKVWRQSSIIAAAVAQLIADNTGQNAVDDGTTTTLIGNLLTAIQNSDFAYDTSGAANSYTIGFTAAPPHPLTDGVEYTFYPAHTNTTASTLAVQGSPATAIVDQNLAALIGGEIVAGGLVRVKYSVPHSAFIIQTNSGGAPHVPTQASNDNTTKAASTAMVQSAIAAAGTVKIIASINSSGVIQHQAGSNTISVSHSGTGTYAITFGVAMPAATYAVVAMSTSGFFLVNVSSGTKTVNGFTIQTDVAAGSSLADSAFDLMIAY